MIDELKDLYDGGWSIIPLAYRDKSPIDPGWTEKPNFTWKALGRYKKNNFGVRLGKHSKVEGGYLHAFDVDIRVPEERKAAFKALQDAFPKVQLFRFPTVKSGSGGESRHIYFVSEVAFKSKRIADSGKTFVGKDGKKHYTWEVDLYGTGKQLVLPPSVHNVTGKKYSWVCEPDFELDLPLISADVIADLYHEIEEGDREGSDEDRAPLGISYAEAESYLQDLDLDEWCEDRQGWRDVGMALHHEFNGSKEAYDLWVQFSKNSRKFDASVQKQQWRSFSANATKPIRMATIIQASRKNGLKAALGASDDDLAMEVAEGASERTSGQKNRVEGDVDLTILNQVLTAAPDFPVDIFGKRLAREIVSQATNSSSPVDFVAAAVLVGASSVIGNAAVVKVKPGFIQPAILWAQIIGAPSSNKSPALRVITRILGKLDQRYAPFWEAAHAEWLKKKEAAEIALKAWKGKMKAIADEGGYVGEMPQECVIPPEPHRRIFLLNDATIEAFVRTQAQCPRGFMTFRDELAGWLGAMERYGNDSERATWLESYEGSTFTMMRVKDGGKMISVPRMCSPVLGGIQPERLRDITASSVVDDGLQARFLPFWPEPKFIPMSSDGVDDTWLTSVFEKLSELSMDGEKEKPVPHVIPMAKEAFEVFRKWSDARNISERHVTARLSGAFGKSTGQIARISLVLELLWWATKPDFDGDDVPPSEVSVYAVEAAIKLRETYIKAMQVRVLEGSNEDYVFADVRKVALWIVETEPGLFTVRDIQRSGRISSPTRGAPSEHISEVLEILVSFGWINKKRKSSGPKGGRPTVTFEVVEGMIEKVKKLAK